MKEVKLFIAGSKTLKEHRKVIREITERINNERRGYRIEAFSYDSPSLQNSQNAYNHFIKNKADIVLFIIEDVMGEKTKQEFKIASKSLKKKNQPEVLVFMRQSNTSSLELATVNGLVEGALDRYYYSYQTIDQLAELVEARIRENLNIRYQRKIQNLKKTARRYALPFLTLLLILICGLAGFIYHKYVFKQTLIIAGGGSAANYIKNEYDLDVQDLEYAYYTPLPSESAWVMLRDEVLSSNKESKYIPIIISASAASDKDFTNAFSSDKFKEKGHVIALCIGYDTLKVTIKKGVPNQTETIGNENLRKRQISLLSLSKLISDTTNYAVYATSPTSGTLMTYKKAFKADSLKDLDQCKLNLFYNNLVSADIKNYNYILMGSAHYSRADLIDGGLYLNVIDSKGKILTKPTYIYFMASPKGDDAENGYLTIPKVTMRLLKELGSTNKLPINFIDTKIKNHKIKPRISNPIILDMEKDLVDVKHWEQE